MNFAEMINPEWVWERRYAHPQVRPSAPQAAPPEPAVTRVGGTKAEIARENERLILAALARVGRWMNLRELVRASGVEYVRVATRLEVLHERREVDRRGERGSFEYRVRGRG